MKENITTTEKSQVTTCGYGVVGCAGRLTILSTVSLMFFTIHTSYKKLIRLVYLKPIFFISYKWCIFDKRKRTNKCPTVPFAWIRFYFCVQPKATVTVSFGLIDEIFAPLGSTR